MSFILFLLALILALALLASVQVQGTIDISLCIDGLFHGLTISGGSETSASLLTKISICVTIIGIVVTLYATAKAKKSQKPDSSDGKLGPVPTSRDRPEEKSTGEGSDTDTGPGKKVGETSPDTPLG